MRTAACAADRVLVVAGAAFDRRHRDANQILSAIDDGATIAALAATLDGEETDRSFMTPGGPSLVFLVQRSPVAVVTLLFGEFLRCHEYLTGDVKIANPAALERLLIGLGIDPSS